jgi:hypothetical protein
MGCITSRDAVFDANHVDDSVHVMLKQSTKEPGPHYYVPRAAHPLLCKRSCHNTVTSEEDCSEVDEALRAEGSERSNHSGASAGMSEEERLLRYAKHHNDLIDPRDRAVYAHDDKHATTTIKAC